MPLVLCWTIADHSLVLSLAYKAMEIAKLKRVLVISAIDVRDRSKPAPSYYTEDDSKASDKMWGQ